MDLTGRGQTKPGGKWRHEGIADLHRTLCNAHSILAGWILRFSYCFRDDPFVLNFRLHLADTAFCSCKRRLTKPTLNCGGIHGTGESQKMRAPAVQLHCEIRQILQRAM